MEPMSRTDERTPVVAPRAGLGPGAGRLWATQRTTPPIPDFPFTYTQPEGFVDQDSLDVDTQVGSEAIYSSAIALETQDIIAFQTYELVRTVSESNLDEAKNELDQLIGQLDRKAVGQTGSTAGLPSVTYEDVGITTVPDGVSRLTVIFDGDREYLINCQASTKPEEIDVGCDEVLSSLAPSG